MVAARLRVRIRRRIRVGRRVRVRIGRWIRVRCSAVGNFCRLRAFDRFGGAFAVGVFGLDGDGLAFVFRFEGVARAGADFFAVGIPAIGDGSHAVIVFQIVGGGQRLSDFCLAADGDFAYRGVVERMRGRVGVWIGIRLRVRIRGVVVVKDGRGFRTVHFFDVALSVGVFRPDFDDFAFVTGAQGVARALSHFFAVGIPAVGDRPHAILVLQAVAGGEGRAHFGFACNFNFACRFVVFFRARHDGVIDRFAHAGGVRFRMAFFVGVFDVQADNAAFVGVGQGVFCFGGTSDFLAVAQPLVFDAFFR